MNFSDLDPEPDENGVWKISLTAIYPSKRDEYLDQFKPDAISTANYAYLYQLFSKLSVISEEREKVQFIDQYMRMFFNAVIFTVRHEDNYMLLTEAEKKLLNYKLNLIEEPQSSVMEDIKKFECEAGTITIDNAEKISELYEKNLQAKKSFYGITYIGTISANDREYILCLKPDEKTVEKNKVLTFCLCLISLSL